MAPPTPRLNGSRATIAPAAAARAAVSSAEPSSTTMMSTDGSSPCTSRTTSAIEAASFQAGMMIRTRLPLIISDHLLDGRVGRGQVLRAGPAELGAQQREVLREGPGL